MMYRFFSFDETIKCFYSLEFAAGIARLMREHDRSSIMSIRDIYFAKKYKGTIQS